MKNGVLDNEEYSFSGIKQFIKDYQNKIKPDIIGSADGDNLEIGNACRGLIEIKFKIKGKSGHAAVPASGVNAISGSFTLFNNLSKQLDQFNSKTLSKSTINIAYILGGQLLSKITIGNQGNIIPDYCEFVIEIRTANLKLTARKVINIIENQAEKLNLSTLSSDIKHDLGSWITPKIKLVQIAINLKTKNFTQAKNRGYIDLQMLWEAFNKPICFTYGVGSDCAHCANEFVEIQNLLVGVDSWIRLLKYFSK